MSHVQSKLSQLVGERRRFGIGYGVGHGEALQGRDLG
jgi:hypothetical protein